MLLDNVGCFPPGFDVDDADANPLADVLRALRLVDVLVTTPVALYVLTVFVRALWTRGGIFHPNLRFLLAALSLTQVFALVGRTIQDAWCATRTPSNVIPNSAPGTPFPFPLSFVFTATNIALYSGAYALDSFVIERIVATLKVATYEHFCRRVPWLGIALYVSEWTISVGVSCMVGPEKVPVYVAFVFVGLTYAIGLFTFVFVLPFVAQRAVDSRIQALDFRLSSRFQATDNLRTAIFLNHFIRRLVAISLAGVLLLGVILTVLPISQRALSLEIFFLFYELGLIYLFVSLLRVHPSLWRFFQSTFLYRRFCTLTVKRPVVRCARCGYQSQTLGTHISSPTDTQAARSAPPPKNLRGEPLEFDVKDHEKIYFAEYARMWQVTTAPQPSLFSKVGDTATIPRRVVAEKGGS